MLKENTTDIRKERHEITQEDFTPNHILELFASDFFSDDFKDKDKVFVDNSCGNGNMLIFVISNKLNNDISYIDTLESVYGIDLMEDNIRECHERIKQLLIDRNIDFDESKVDEILNEHIVCYDALDWNYKEWKPNFKIEHTPLF